MSYRVALAQMDPVLGDLTRNVQRHVDMVHQAKDAGAQLVCFPELSLTGYSVKDLHTDLAISPGRDGGRLDPLLKESEGITVVAGGIEWADTGAVYNAAFLLEEGKYRVVHRKVYLPTYGMFEEMRYFSRGDRIEAVETAVGRIGVMICEDSWHISIPYLLAMDGAGLLVSLVASPTRLSAGDFAPRAVNVENSRSHARLLSLYVAFCNRTGYEDGVNFWGGSHVVAPGGEVIASADVFDDRLLVATIDPERIRRARVSSRHFLDEDHLLTLRELERLVKARREGPAR